MRKKWYEREEVGKVTLDWVKVNCKNITYREVDLLHAVYDRKMVRRDHLEIILPEYRYLKSRTKVLNRSISKLFAKMCLDKVHEEMKVGEGNSPAILALDKAGAVILDKPFKRRFPHIMKKYRGEEYLFRVLPSIYRHVHGVNQLEVDTILLCEEQGLEMNWVHERYNSRKFFYSQEEMVFIPDALLSLWNDKAKMNIFIEYDTGSENARFAKNFPIILEKLLKYRKYKASKKWEEEFDRFPSILFVTEDEKRLKYVNNKMKELGLQGVALYHERYIDVLKRLTGKS